MYGPFLDLFQIMNEKIYGEIELLAPCAQLQARKKFTPYPIQQRALSAEEINMLEKNNKLIHVEDNLFYRETPLSTDKPLDVRISHYFGHDR